MWPLAPIETEESQPTPEPQVAEPGELELGFHGDASGYFRIWIVNLALTLLTLGLFSPWATVRKKRYLYANTFLDGTPFQYQAKPLPILRGRLVAMALALFYFVGTHFFPGLLWLFLLVALFLLPMLITRSLAFNARYSVWRNVSLRFDGTPREVARCWYWLGVLPLFAVGFVAVNNHPTPESLGLFGLAMLPAILLFPWWLARLRRFNAAHTVFGGQRGEVSIDGGELWRIFFTSSLPFVAVPLLAVAGILMGMDRASLTQVASVVYYLCYVGSAGLAAAQLGNLEWNRRTLGPLQFHSTMRVWPMLGLYLTNALAIVCSLGLLVPWAAIRTLRYRIDHLQPILYGHWNEFAGQPERGIDALGAEVTEIFDLDVSL